MGVLVCCDFLKLIIRIINESVIFDSALECDCLSPFAHSFWGFLFFVNVLRSPLCRNMNLMFDSLAVSPLRFVLFGFCESF